MKFLLDTNIIIPLEPGSLGDVEAGTTLAMELASTANKRGVQLFVHPESKTDIRRDRDAGRRALRELSINRYPLLQSPPQISTQLSTILGQTTEDDNDWVDHNLLAALDADAIDFLITEDQGIHKKASRLSLSERVLTVADALALLKNLYDTVPPPPPAVKKLLAYELNDADPIFTSLREDYDGFDAWLSKCKREHRISWIVERQSGKYGCIGIVKQEDITEYNLTGKVLKICTFKVSEEESGFRIGELLLKTILLYCRDNQYDCVYVTAFSKHVQLINLLKTFGFDVIDQQTNLGELVLAKRMKPIPGEESSYNALEFNVTFGPFWAKIANTPAYIVPIVPAYHDMLFPELSVQRGLFQTMNPFGNSIRKAYLSKSNINAILPGSNLLFYRSGGSKTVNTLGVVEDAQRFYNAEDVVRHVGNRTVYSYDEIVKMLEGSRGVLSILFRQSITLNPPLEYPEMASTGVLRGYPQSIVTIADEGVEWLQNRIRQ
jgi:N-acetylglutamate synthase-like GNAT family acetyltransferase